MFNREGIFLIFAITAFIFSSSPAWSIHLPREVKEKDLPCHSCETSGQVVADQPPHILKKTLEDQYQSGNATVKFDLQHRALYLLNYHSKSDKSLFTLYLFKMDEKIVSKVVLPEKYTNATISAIYVEDGIIVAYCKEDKLLAVSRDVTKTWEIWDFSYDLEDVLINKQSSYDIVVFGGSKLFVLNKEEQEWFECASYAEKPMWNPQDNYLYYIYPYRYLIIWEYKDLYRLSGDPDNWQEEIRSTIDDYGFLGNLIWIHDEDLYISIDGGEFSSVVFPYYFKPKLALPEVITANELFVVAVNDTNDTYLYSGAITDLRLSRITGNIGESKSNEQFCANLVSFEHLLGVLISQRPLDDGSMQTVISYNHGYTWGHLIPPATFDGNECIWPKCYLTLFIGCDGTQADPILTSADAPNIMVARGVFTHDGVKKQGFYISSDAGLSWTEAIEHIATFTILDRGSVMVGFPEVLHDIYYSLNYGLTWNVVQVTKEHIKIIASPPQIDDSSLETIIVGFDDNNYKYNFISIDFSNILIYFCEDKDYEMFTPGATKRDQCYQGTQYGTPRRKHFVNCKNKYESLPKLEVKCPCTGEDFGCSYGYYNKDGTCITDPDISNTKIRDCSRPGDLLVVPSRYSRLIGDVCIANDIYKDEEAHICSFTEDESTVTYLIGRKLWFILLNDIHQTESFKLPFVINSKTKIRAFFVDFYGKCLYYANSSGIMRTCWTHREDTINSNAELFFLQKNIDGMQFDRFTRNLFYVAEFKIYMLHLDTRFYRVVLSSNIRIKSLAINERLGLLAYVTHRSVGSLVEEKIHIADHTGDLKNTVELNEHVSAINFDSSAHFLLVIGETSMFNVSVKHSISSKKPLNHSDIINFYDTGSDFVYISQNNITFGHFSLNFMIPNVLTSFISIARNKSFISPCTFSHCDFMCVTDAESYYKCLCPEGLDHSISNASCSCPISNPTCRKCSPGMFQCRNYKCLDISIRCNGVNNCGDNSDEENCSTPITCKDDEFTCDSNSRCISLKKKCDNVIDCEDETDEIYCGKIPQCEETEFLCSNLNCILREKYCDGVDDCGDNSDEDSCDGCAHFEVKCNSGDCILPSQLCNGIFDCADWSDEKNCKVFTVNSTNISCALTCDGRCIPANKICDHFADCPNMEDERYCNYHINCPQGYLQCDTTFECYQSQNCFGFLECKDGSDRKKCDSDEKCYPFEHETCDGYKCIVTNDFCDGHVTCSSGYDEERCDESYVKHLKVVSRENTNLTLSWVTNLSPPKAYYNVTVISMRNMSLFSQILTTERSLTLTNLSDCELYQIYVKLFGGGTRGREVKVFAKPKANYVPKNVHFDKNMGRLVWNATIIKCFPVSFYVECTQNGRVAYRNFTNNQYMVLNFKDHHICRVAGCMTQVFNSSCSGFSSPVHIKKSIMVIIGASVGAILFIIIVIICITLWRYCYVRQRQSKTCVIASLPKETSFNNNTATLEL